MKKVHPHKHRSKPVSWLSFVTLLAIGIAAFIFPSYISPQIKTPKQNTDPANITVKVQQVTDNLEAPTALAFPGNGDIWVTEQKGKIRVIKNGKLIDGPLLDLKSKMIKVNNGYEERGLLGIALHPKFKTNRKFYVFYSAPSANKSNHMDVIAEYKVPANAGPIDPNSGRIILTQEKPDGNHDGGCLQFGADGYLYFSFGDGGGQGDKHGEIGNGQKLDILLGKISRIDINTPNGYLVPRDNPFVGRKDARPEIWAYGFRNPYRFSFDKITRQLFAGDVGQDLWEEVDIVKKGANYGWRLFEGTHPYNPASGSDTKGITMPITEYSHKEGVSVIGGYIYNGNQVPVLKSKYFFADWAGPVFYLQKAGAKWLRGKVVLQNIPPSLKITGFGEDPSGELYMLTNPDTGPGNTKGCVYKIVKN
ncbi:PQQ-dependent sugar dehydrogenase [Mucilaginibacter sp. FT3.2]|uniref:PQQ-dependent sugar dehydrogenase n=1 Tax=Mucilaginibacter sp. FT3.2 TaxID=2723090 RepID=UPI001619FE7B|nr:PQQ-dependent sugar dehydrogenase [Mucilaginibacter sp. FT3.2]MBB6235242.1 glucose/arabinose dehydrogenase [Mucilaginibacter sp. FT3.2]